jgi:hypothetical protein
MLHKIQSANDGRDSEYKPLYYKIHISGSWYKVNSEGKNEPSG